MPSICRALSLAALVIVLVPLSGWSQTVSQYVAIAPCRMLDTRTPVGNFGGILQRQTSRTLPFASGPCGTPANATAYALNVTVIPQEPLIFMVLWPTGQAQPFAATLTSDYTQIVSNFAIVGAGTSGSVSVYASNTTHVIIDVFGYMIPQTNALNQSTAFGIGASDAGNQNTALGLNALQLNSSGNLNTAAGALALASNTSGNNNVAVGAAALNFDATGSANTALGAQSLLNNLIGNDNTALGFNSLYSTTVGSSNTAAGDNSQFSNSSGSFNTSVGESSLYSNLSGSWNVALGYNAGSEITSGSYNVDIAAQGLTNDSNVIRIGTPGDQTSTFIAGINGVNISSGSSMLINSNGQIGTIQSSIRYKEDVRDMGRDSSRLFKLRPVTFHYRQDRSNARVSHYGLIAEEVEAVYPELVVHDNAGRPESIQYHEIPSMLLNEIQRQQRTIEDLARRLNTIERLLYDRQSTQVPDGSRLGK